MRFLTLFISTLALSSGISASSMSSSSNHLSTVNRAGGWGNVDSTLEAGRYESSHQHQWGTMAEPAGTTPHFAYSPWDLEAGPAMWATVGAAATPSWSTCAGNSQSPVALPTYMKAKPDTAGILKKLSPSYGTSLPAGSLTLVNTGHALQVNFPNGTNSLSLTGGALGVDGNNNPIQYTALQMHMHGRSEHSIGGARFPLELHIVHKDLTRGPNDPRLLTVVGIMVEESPDGTPNPFLLPLSNLVMSPDYTSPLNNKDGMAITNMAFSLSNLLPKNLDYYHYNGSLTTPPCSEQVVWHVLTNPITASRSQILALTAPFGDVGNARPTQPLGTREIVVSSFQTAPNGNTINSASSVSMTLAGVVTVVMAIVKMQ